MSLFDDISVFHKGSRCQKCRKKFNSWVGYYRHTARCMGMGLTSSIGIAYTYFIALISLGVVTLLYILFSIPVDWVYDIIMNTWLLANPAVFSEARIESYNWMMSIWALMPVMMLISMIIFVLQRTITDRTRGR
tara:strand:+ start:432 stop:833 length:402 start_codon:yes stop_codon:yes gene_type:complete